MIIIIIMIIFMMMIITKTKVIMVIVSLTNEEVRYDFTRTGLLIQVHCSEFHYLAHVKSSWCFNILGAWLYI